MKKFLILLALSFTALAQVPDDLRIRGSLRKLPLSLSINPDLQYEKSKERTLYSYPVKMVTPSLLPASHGNGWWEVRKKTKTQGIGFRIPVEMKPGLAIFKGSSQTSVRRVLTRAPAADESIFPVELGQVASWETGDSGESESFGGIIARMSFRISGLPSVTAVVGIQNSFRLTLRKLGERKAELLVAEEKLSERTIRTSVEVARLSLTRMKNRKISFRFVMDPKSLAHQKLFQSALKGDLLKLQSELESSRQSLNWVATQKKISVGVPVVRKESWTWTDLHYAGTKDSLYVRAKSSKGKIGLKRSRVEYALLEETGMTLHWTHEMKKMTEVRFMKFFLRPLVQLGINPESMIPPRGMKFGKVITEISVHIAREEFRQENWHKIRRQMAVGLLNDPSKIQKLFPGKRVRVKFWSDRLQSFEGDFNPASGLPEAR